MAEDVHLEKFNTTFGVLQENLNTQIQTLTDKSKEGEMNMADMMKLQRLGQQLSQMAELGASITSLFHSAYMSAIRNTGKTQ